MLEDDHGAGLEERDQEGGETEADDFDPRVDGGDAAPVIDGGAGLEEGDQVVQEEDGKEVEHGRAHVQEDGEGALAPSVSSQQDARDGGFGGFERLGLGLGLLLLIIAQFGHPGVVLRPPCLVDFGRPLHLLPPQIVRQRKGRSGPISLGRDADVVGLDDLTRAVAEERIEVRQEPVRQAAGLILEGLGADPVPVHQGDGAGGGVRIVALHVRARGAVGLLLLG